jgi:hypothetical protein
MPQSSSDTVASDTNCLYCRVVEVRHTNRYRFATKFGVLTQQVSSYGSHQKLRQQSIYRNPPSTISLHAATAKISTSTRVGISCNCKPPRCLGRCCCIKNNMKCSVHCHSSEFDCANLSSLLQRTEEIALVPRQARLGGPGST